jgi:site-specific DNA-methyltransferase (cytosine-N4-specific)
MKPKISRTWSDSPTPQLAYKTDLGSAYQSSIEDFLESRFAKELRGKVQLVFTSPPFPLASPKSYGNHNGTTYIEWMIRIVESLKPLLKPTGSIVIEIGNAWDKGSPTMSTVPLETLIRIGSETGLHICQQFICNNPNRLPSPVVYVNKERIRVKDSFTHVWWYGKKERPYANNRSVLREYSPAMKRLLKTQTYNHGLRPSEHQIGETSFLKDNGGSIPSSVLEFGGSSVNKHYREWCIQNDLKQHPAKMAESLADFFIQFLTRKGDLVLDPFGGSNTTGSVAENLGRNWVSVERDHQYLLGSIGRFMSKEG